MKCLPKKHGALFIFGDSLFDNGNNNYINTTIGNQANYPPYGQTFFRYPSGRFSDGRMIPDFVGTIFPKTYVYFFRERVPHILPKSKIIFHSVTFFLEEFSFRRMM